MTEEKFTELVNLYLDKEISAEDLERMKAEISANSERKRVFVDRCRLHKAMRMALEPDHSRSGGSSSSWSSVSGPGVFVPRWLLLSGAAASLVLGFMLLSPLYKSVSSSGGNATWVDAALQKLSPEEEVIPLQKSELRRYASVREHRQANPRASLVSQMRLMGLRPEHTPQDKQLERIDLAAIYKPVQQVNQAELFRSIQALKATSQAKFIQINGADDSSAWPRSWSNSWSNSWPSTGSSAPSALQPPPNGIKEL